MKYTYIDLFAGCGGLSLGLYNAGWNGLFAIEKNKDAFTTLKTNLISNKNHFRWPDWLQKENIDIKQLLNDNSEQLVQLNGKVTLVVGGPPCQGFSMAGKRNADDFRNKLCNYYLKFIRIVKPEVLIFENVHGFTVGLSKDGIKQTPYSTKVLNSLKRMKYKVNSKIIDVADFGVPQHRKRYIIIATRNIDCRNFFNILEKNRDDFLSKRKLEANVTIEEAIGDLKKSNGVFKKPSSKRFNYGHYIPCTSLYQDYMRKNIDSKEEPDSHRFPNHTEDTIKVFKKIMNVSNESKRISPKDNLVEGLKKRGVTPLKSICVCNTITSIPDDYIHYCEPRVLTVREMARIQSFPDWYKFKGKYTTGGKLRKVDVPRYTQVANAVPPLFAEQVGIAIKEMLNNE